MKRLALLAALAGCSGAPPPPGAGSDASGDFGLPPAGDGGLSFSLGTWEAERVTDPEGYRLLAGYSRARAGQSVDLDGDGEVDIAVWREPDGRLVQWYLVGRAYFRPLWVAQRFLDGRTTLEIDRDENQPFDVLVETDPRLNRRVEQYDDDFNRAFERRRTLTTDAAAGTQLVVEERDAQQNGTWVETRRFTLQLHANQAEDDGCNGVSNFPLEPFADVPLVLIHPSIGIVVDETQVKCSGENVKAAKEAALCAIKKIDSCLRNSNAEVAARVQAALSNGYVNIGCNNPCPGRDATTLSPRMNLRSNFSTLTPDERCAIVLHELMHHADVPRDDTHKDGVDRVYACARYCNKCVKRGPTAPPPSDQDDCVTCAETGPERARCGVKEDVVDGTCTGNALCSGGLGGNMPCETCSVKVQKDCKGSRLDDRETYLCCKTCPNGYPTNPTDCRFSNPTLSNTCNMKPPGC